MKKTKEIFMSNELIKMDESFEFHLSNIEGTRKMVEALMKTPHYAKMGVEGMYAIVAKAKAIGIDPMNALSGALYYVNGRVGMSSELMACLVRQAGHSITKDPGSTDTKCIIHGKRKDNGDTWTVSFSIDDAKRAGIYREGTPWGKFPSVMCYNRAMSMLFRQLFADLSKGAGYTKDELEEIRDTSTLKEVEAVVEEQTITEAQHRNIAELIGDDTEFQKDLLKRMNTAFGCNSFLSLPSSRYDDVLKIIKRHNEKRLQEEMNKKGEVSGE
jgi:hypothetical protein